MHKRMTQALGVKNEYNVVLVFNEITASCGGERRRSKYALYDAKSVAIPQVDGSGF